MTPTTSGDPAPQLTREAVDLLHAAMLAAEPDWQHQTRALASALDSAIARLPRATDRRELETVVNEYRRDTEAWLRAADEYFAAVGGPIADVLPLEDDS